MKATTKYDIGDWVWSLRDNRAVRLDVTRVIVSIEGDGLCEVSYSLHYGDGEIPESKLFKTRTFKHTVAWKRHSKSALGSKYG